MAALNNLPIGAVEELPAEPQTKPQLATKFESLTAKYRDLEKECLDLSLRKEFLKTKEASVRRSIEFYRTALIRLSNTYDIDIES